MWNTPRGSRHEKALTALGYMSCKSFEIILISIRQKKVSLIWNIQPWISCLTNDINSYKTIAVRMVKLKINNFFTSSTIFNWGTQWNFLAEIILSPRKNSLKIFKISKKKYIYVCVCVRAGICVYIFIVQTSSRTRTESESWIALARRMPLDNDFCTQAGVDTRISGGPVNAVFCSQKKNNNNKNIVLYIINITVK